MATVDAIVERLEKSGGRPSELLAGVVQSAPFQKTRAFAPAEKLPSTEPVTPRRRREEQRHEHPPEQHSANITFAFNRRRFLRGLGACIALPAFESLGAFQVARRVRQQTGNDRPRRSPPHGVRVFSEWRHSRCLVASRRGQRLRLQPDAEAAGAAAPAFASARRSRSEVRLWRAGRRRRSRAGQRRVSHRCAFEEERDGHSRGPFDRSGHRPRDRSSHALSVARTEQRCHSHFRRLRFRLRLRLSIQSFLEFRDDARGRGV